MRSTREGREQSWEIEPQRLAAANRYLEQSSKRWDETIERLRAFVETDDGWIHSGASSLSGSRRR